ncbi:hypothetical protein CVIRNUC_005761 [Coccomyxa viridis]|uniref:Rhodanese domain-containing protein n=1 Tax=Coccomyxa viridis TaxID=1274662 RepID=A0AAV1I5C0_9CHLO|nr:hypothetical protein CVIRNUC_005761 [Coccomyxa viridis]
MADMPDVPTTSAQEAGPLVLERKAPYLDVRTPEEFSREHVSGSINVPWILNLTTRQVNPCFVEEAKKALPGADAHVIVSCQVGRRGAMATKALQDADFTNAVNLAGGLQAWTMAGLPTDK